MPWNTRVPLVIPFALGLVAFVGTTVLLPGSRFFCFSPFLALLYGRVSLLKALWIAAGCGLIMDLTSAEWILGTSALNLSLTTFLLYRQKRHFFVDEMVPFALFTAMISCVSGFLYLSLAVVLQHASLFSLRSLLTELLLMSALDALYALVWFALPIKFLLAKKRANS